MVVSPKATYFFYICIIIITDRMQYEKTSHFSLCCFACLHFYQIKSATAGNTSIRQYQI